MSCAPSAAFLPRSSIDQEPFGLGLQIDDFAAAEASYRGKGASKLAHSKGPPLEVTAY
jgi:hypothetical protein